MNKLFNSEARVKILAVLYGMEYCEYTYLVNKLNITDGNLWNHLKKLEQENYILIKKYPLKNKIKTIIKLTDLGRENFKKYLIELLELSNSN